MEEIHLTYFKMNPQKKNTYVSITKIAYWGEGTA